MKFSKITRQLALISILPIIGIVAFLTLYIYNNFNRAYEINAQKRINLINEEIRKLHEFELRTLKNLESELDARLKGQIRSITEEIEVSPLPLRDIDLLSLREQLGLDPATQEIYISNSNGVIVNTTDRQSYLQNFNNLDFTPSNQFLDLIGSDKVTVKPLALEKASGQLRKLAFNTGSRGDFMVMIKNYPSVAQSIMDYLEKSIEDLVIEHNTINRIDVYINPESPAYLYGTEAMDVDAATVVKTVFENKSRNLKLPSNQYEDMVRIFNHYEYKRPGLLKQYVVEVVFNEEKAKSAFIPIFRSTLITIIVATVLIILLILFFIRKYVVTPSYRIKNSLKKLAAGNISEETKLNYYRRNEFGDIVQLYNQVIDELNDLANFIEELGRGNVEVEFSQEVTEDDVLSKYMIGLRDNIKRLEQERTQRERADEIQDWMTEGLQYFNQVMQRTGNEINNLSIEVLKNLVQYIDAQQGAIYILADMEKSDSVLEQTATFAYNQKITRKQQIKMREGLVGMVAAEKSKIYRTEIPDDYTEISTGLGRTPPKSILFVPIKIEEQLLGVIELASLHKMEDYQIEFVEQVASNVSHNIMTAKNNERNEQLLEQFSKQSEQFQQQEKELKQQIEQLQEENAQKDTTIENLRKDINTLNEKLAKARGRINELKQ